MRLFVALMPPGEIVDELQRTVSALRTAAPELTWTRPEHWHLTLAFLGEVDEKAHGELVTRLPRAAGRHAPVELRFARGGRFSGRVLWTGVDGDRERLRRLVASVRAGARRCGIVVDQRPYRPHLTLARSTRPAHLRPLVERLRGFHGTPWRADAVHLVRSDLGAGIGGTARHEPIASWPLRAGPER